MGSCTNATEHEIMSCRVVGISIHRLVDTYIGKSRRFYSFRIIVLQQQRVWQTQRTSSSMAAMKESKSETTQVSFQKARHADITNSLKPVKWYRSTFFNMTILGLCNFSAPGIWGAMNSLGAGGAQSPHLVNAGNALTFCLMVVSCYFSSVMVHYIGIKGALIFGT
jgi:hypothetical protein